MNQIKNCLCCEKPLHGRSDKRFCSISCKNAWNAARRRTTRSITEQIDTILHRNREILAVLMGEKTNKMEVDRLVLDRAGFNFKYITGIYTNSQGKLYHYVYDFAWMEFSKQVVMIVRK